MSVTERTRIKRKISIRHQVADTDQTMFIHGKPIKKLTGDNILDQFMDEIYKL